MRTQAAPMPRDPPEMRATLLESERGMDIAHQFPVSRWPLQAKTAPGEGKPEFEIELPPNLYNIFGRHSSSEVDG
jgi:hypothetical protein